VIFIYFLYFIAINSLATPRQHEQYEYDDFVGRELNLLHFNI